MPVKDPTIYPRHWKQFSLYIRTERSGGKCEVCGVDNYAVGARDRFGEFRTESSIHSLNSDVGLHLFGDSFTFKMSRIVLTVAHLDAEGDICRCQDETGFLCANPDHVKAMCQKCHNSYDRPKRNKNAKITNEAKKDANRGLFTEAA
jgi:hypothetical protein